jgi:hypothetical protein
MNQLSRTVMLLALACAAAAAALAASEFMDTFQFVPPGGEAVNVPGSAEAADRHNYALLVLAVFALGALIIALVTGSQVAHFAVAAAGVVALMIFLIGDLPDANKIGTIDDERQSFIDAKAEPQAGFWLELVGSITLAVCGIALATLRGQEERAAAQPSQASAAGSNAPERAR